MSPAWFIPYKLRHRIAWQPPTEFRNDLNPCGVVDLKMCCSTYSVKLIQIVRDHSQVDESFAEFLLDLDGIVDSAQQHRLVECRDSAADQFTDRVGSVAG